MLIGFFGRKEIPSDPQDPADKERIFMLWDKSYYPFSEMAMAIEKGRIDEGLREERLLPPIRSAGSCGSDSILNTEKRLSEQNGLSRRSDLFSSKLLYPATHPLVSIRSEIKNDVGILVKVKDGKVFFGVDDDGIFP